MTSAQLSLFDDPAEAPRKKSGFAAEPISFATEERLARALPPNIRLGTSSWTYADWNGIVFPGNPSPKELAAEGLAYYARNPLFTTVSLDRAYYAPVPDADLERYDAQLPEGFQCLVKVWSGVTTYRDRRTGEKIPTFLDVRAFEDAVVAPLRRSFSKRVGALVLEFPPFAQVPPPDAFARRLDRFLSEAPRDFPISVELRNRELFTRRYLDVLIANRVGHTINYWEAMPDVGAQCAMPGVLDADPVVCRVLIKPGTRYEQRKAALMPFNAVKDPDPKMRADVARLAEICVRERKKLFITVNNKSEGCSPLTVRALAERITGLRVDP